VPVLNASAREKAMDIPNRAAIVLVVCMQSVSAIVIADEPEPWSRQYRQTLVQTCYEQSVAQTTEIYRQAFNGVMDNRSFEAFLVSNSTQLATTCQCLFNRISNQFSPSEFETKTTQVSTLSEALVSEGGACATDVERVIADALARLEMTEGGDGER